jgi:hypothetical protein
LRCATGGRKERPAGDAGAAQPSYAVFGAKAYVARHPVAATAARYEECRWIGFDDTRGHSESLLWLIAKIGRAPHVRCSNASAILDTLIAGAGLAVLPCFLGAEEPALMQLSAPIDDLDREGLWLVLHEDMRDRPRVPMVADRIAAVPAPSPPAAAGRGLKHFPPKWLPVRRRKYDRRESPLPEMLPAFSVESTRDGRVVQHVRLDARELRALLRAFDQTGSGRALQPATGRVRHPRAAPVPGRSIVEPQIAAPMGIQQPEIEHGHLPLPPAAPEPSEPRQAQAIPNPGHRILLLPTGMSRFTTFRNE